MYTNNNTWYLEPLSKNLLDSIFYSKSNTKTSNIFTVEPSIKDGIITSKFKLAGYEKDEIKFNLLQYSENSTTRDIEIKANNNEYGSITYVTSIPKNIDEKLTKASLKNGILTLTFIQEKVKCPFANLKIQID